MIAKIEAKKYSITILTVLLLVIVFSFFLGIWDCFDKTIFFIFQNRDIGRARSILEGQLIFYGPEMTGGGNLPGSLYYILLAISQFFSRSWISAWFMQYLLVLISIVAGYFFFRSKSSKKIAITWLMITAISPFTYNYLRIFLNVSSMYLFVVLALIFIYKLYDLESEDESRKKYFYLACFSIGLGLHFHFSVFCFYIALALINIFSKKLDVFRVPSKVFIKGTAFLVLPCLPYIIWSLADKAGFYFGTPPFYSGESVNAPASLMQLMSYGYDEKFFWVFVKVISSVTPLSFLILAPLMFIKDKEITNAKRSFNRIKAFGFCSLVSLLPVLEVCFSPQASRYTLPFCLAMIFLTLSMYEKVIESEFLLKKFNKGAFVLQILILLIFINYFPVFILKTLGYSLLAAIVFLGLLKLFDSSFSLKSKSFIISFFLISSLTTSQYRLFTAGAYAIKDWSLFMPKYEDWRVIWSDINNATGWSYEKAKSRIYYVGHHLEQDPELALAQVNSPNEHKVANDLIPAGFFVSSRYRTYGSKFRKRIPAPREWLMSQNLQPELKKGIESGDIRLGNNISKSILILPYWVENNKNVPDYFHNMGEGYSFSAADRKLWWVNGAEGVLRNTKKEFIFKWNESPDQHYFCATGAIVDLQTLEDNNYSMTVNVVGATLSQITPWVSPNWTQAWINPYAEVTCINGEKLNFVIASSIGFNRSVSQDVKTPILQGNNSFVGPFRKEFKFSCKNGIKRISIGRSGSKVDSISNVLELPERILSIDI